ncbi:hypothetical protein GH741_01320 [Aquibacillus halophilus]|uniref:LysM domain-containing protein n=1 Tax=Aquibacillus halophilus TaxID=930132 RepID=A0A6A8DC08_9BACI|nr:hypothetical protein [Aquibacillus halophilus]MRH41311.1 hypothetical protein [Aquibacillus halophilus]
MNKTKKILAPTVIVGIIFGAAAFSVDAAENTNSNMSIGPTSVAYHTIVPGHSIPEVANSNNKVTVADVIEANPKTNYQNIPTGSKVIIPLD